jgi:hypothetical protein
MPADLRIAAKFADLIEAELARGRLNDEGLNAVIANDISTNVMGLGYTTGGIELLVPAEELDRARAVLADFAKEIEVKKQPPPPYAITAQPRLPEAEETPEEIAARPNFAEDLVVRAYRASILGYFLICWPVVHLYALLMLLYATFSGEEIRPNYSTKYFFAFILSAASVGLGGLILAQFLPTGWFAVYLSGSIAMTMFVFTILRPWKRK